MRIVFVCKTCEYMNSMEAGTDGYAQREMEFDTLTSAYSHLKDTDSGYQTYIHEVIVEVKDE